MILRVAALLVLLVGAVLVARRQRWREPEKTFEEALRELNAQFAELARVMGEQLTPAVRAAADAIAAFGRAWRGET